MRGFLGLLRIILTIGAIVAFCFLVIWVIKQSGIRLLEWILKKI